MSKRKPGSIRQRGAGYEIQIELTGVNGERRRRFVTVRGTYEDAKKKLAELLKAANEGTLPDPCNATLADYLRAWINGSANVSPKTGERYGELIERQVIPHLGATKLQKLLPEHVQQWHGKLIDEGLAPRTVGHAHRVLRRALADAVKNGTIARNVAAVHSPPRVEETEIEILSPDQIGAVLKALDGHGIFPIVSLALATGMRRGELLGLQWQDIDLDAGTLRVERAVEETKKKLRLKSPKTKRGRRNVKLPTDAVTVLRAHKVKQLELRLALGMGNIAPDTLVFGTVDGEIIRPRNLTKSWSRVRAAMKLPSVSFHAFRHSHASMLIRAGVDILTVSRRLGHANASITLNVYGHLIEGADAAAAKAIEGALK